MTIRMLASFNGRMYGSIAELSAAEESRLVTAGLATYDLAPPALSAPVSGGIASAGCVQTLKLLGAAGSTVGAAYTFSSAWTVEGDYDAVRFQYCNYGTGAYTITAAKTAPAPSVTDTGTSLSFSNVTFDGAASAKCGDVWNGLVGSATTFVVDPAISAAGANTVPKIVWSDWVPQQSVPCTDAGNSDLRVVHHRVYSATTGYAVANTGSSANNFGNYNSNSRRKVYGQLSAGNLVGTISAVTLAAGWQWMMCTGIQVLLRKPIYNHGIFMDSLGKGQGSFSNADGLWGWAQRATQGLSDAGIGRHSVVNYSCSGQGKAATWATFLAVIDQGGLDTAIMFPWSPNDGISAGSAPWNLNAFKFQINAFIAACRRNRVRPIVATQPPCGVIVDAESDVLRVAFNGEIRALADQGIAVADFDMVLRNGALPGRFASAMTNGDQVHPSDAGHAAMDLEYRRAVRRALGI